MKYKLEAKDQNRKLSFAVCGFERRSIGKVRSFLWKQKLEITVGVDEERSQ